MMPGKRTIRKKKQLSWEAVGHSLRSRTAQCVYVILAGAVILCILFMAAITPQRYDLKVGDISHTTITASKDVVDESARRPPIRWSPATSSRRMWPGRSCRIWPPCLRR